ncbi:hypothetical protein BGZ96_001763 [Linnemannia gamsii]|uniref:Uncharacterized protein n=1 Tax=Linnemannia gamsii TaxID=64522 RepID=A0ABQ7JM40_9FUNG|nr:hypothetical protein BGZ96_001763 [Linnemannia gamsii]
MERNARVKEVVRQLITGGPLTRVAQTPLTAAHKDDVLIITGERLERVLRTQEAIDVLRPYFNNTPLFIHGLSTKGITLPKALDNSAVYVDEDYEDLRLFVELGSMWQQPRKLNGMTSSFLFELEVAGYQGLPPVTKSDPASKFPEKKIIQANMERAKSNEVGSKWRSYVSRLVRRRVLAMENGAYAMNQDLEDRCREAAPELPREIIDVAEIKRNKAQRKTAASEARLSNVSKEEDWGPGAQKRIRHVSGEDDDVVEGEKDGEDQAQVDDEEMRAASPHTNTSSSSGKEAGPPKKRGRTTRRSLAIQAEEDAIAAAKDREEQGQDEGDDDIDDEEEGGSDGDGGFDKKKETKVKKTEKDDAADDDDDEQKVKVKDEADTDSTSKVTTKPQPQDDDNSAVKKEEDTEDKKPLHLEIPQHMVLEKGHAYFFYRPKIDIGDKQKPRGTEDVQKLYMLLSPEAAVGRVSTLADSKQDGLASSGKKSEEKVGSEEDKDGDGDGGKKVTKKDDEEEVKKEDGGGALHRLLIISRKALPVYQPSNTTGSGANPRGNRPGARNWAFVDTASSDLAKVESRLREYSYTTKTRGDRTQAAARFIAQAHYEVVLDHVDPEHPQRQSSHFVYQLEVPTTPGPVQEAFKIAKEGQFLVQVKNPRIQTPATERGAVRYATLKDKAASFPQHLQERFRGVRKDEVRYAPMDTCEFLDVVHTELVLLGVKRGAREEFEDVLKELEEDVEEEARGWSESESEAEEGGGGGGLEQVYKELDVDEATIPAAVDVFK